MAKPAKCISVSDAQQLQNNWKSTRAVDIKKAMGFEDTREFVYSVEELQEFIDYVKSESLKQGITDPGVRFYFAAYDNSLNDKATMFLAPTESGASNSDNNYSIDPMNVLNGGWPPKNY